MIASATVSTITIAVAADKPPMKAAIVKSRSLRRQRQRQHEHVAVDAARREGQQAGERDRHHEQIDQDEIERKQPGRAPDLGLAEWFSTTVTWNCRGSSRIATNDSSVIAITVEKVGGVVSTAAVFGSLSARENRVDRAVEHPEGDEHRRPRETPRA